MAFSAVAVAVALRPHRWRPLRSPLSVVEAEQWRYYECLRNRAADLGKHELDDCGEFISGSDGAAALYCAACGCHRSFHWREAIPGGGVAAAVAASPSPATPIANSSLSLSMLLAPPYMRTHQPTFLASPASAPAALTESSSEELRGPAPAPPAPPPTHPAHPHPAVGGSASASPAPRQKRFQTKFTPEQKDSMLEFAHRVGWRINKADSNTVDAFCNQIDVNREALKVWMNNHKRVAKIPLSPPTPPPHHHPPPSPPPSAAA